MTTRPADPQDAELDALRARAKAEIRRQLRSVRRVLPQSACDERAARACERLSALPEITGARTVVAYVAMRKELDPSVLCASLRSTGKRIGLPRIADDAQEDADNALMLHLHERDDVLIENALGVLEPAHDAEQIALHDVDVILVPALALDTRGYRIGYGGGYYDRLLPALPNAFKIGLVYDFQLIAEAPNEAHDAPVDCIVTDTRIILAAGR